MASLPDNLGYEIEVYTGGETGYVRTKFTLDVTSGVATFKKGGTAVNGTSLVLDKANVAFKAQDLNGNSVEWPGISVFSAATCTTEASILNIEECDPESLEWIESSRNGIAMAKLANGTYWVSMNPYSAGFDSKTSLTKFTVTGGIFSLIEGPASRIPASDTRAVLNTETLVLTARAANFKANVTTQAGVSVTGGWADSDLDCDNCDVGEFERSSGDIDSSGRLGLYLPAAPSEATRSYDIRVYPTDLFARDAAEATFVATVDDRGVVTVVSSSIQPEVNLTSPTNGLWTLRLPAPNFSGAVLMPAGNDVARYSNFDVQKWVDGEYRHGDDIPNVYTDDEGRFSGYFTPGRYLITVNPPYELANVADKDYEIVITANGDACLFDGVNSSTCETPVALGEFNLRLATPNVSGVVTMGGAALTSELSDYANISLRKWNTEHSYWEWDRWSEVSDDGSYSLNIQSAGTYQIVVEPGFIEGYSSGYEYLVVVESPSGFMFCKIPEPGLDTLSRATCGGNTAILGPITADIALQQSNFQANVTVPVGFDGWVNASIAKIFELPGSGERQMHSAHVELRQVGDTNVYTGFSSLDDNNNNPAKYRIDFSAEPNRSDGSLPLARVSTYVWAYNFDETDSEIEICPEKFYDKVGQDCLEGMMGTSTPMNVALRSGNLAGAVKTPIGDAVPRAWINVQKWEKSDWSADTWHWNWIDLYASANKQGAFALNAEEPGFYKLQTRQQRGGKLPFADSITLIKVAENGDWCVLEGEIVSYGETSSPTANTDCTLGRDNDLSETDQVSGLTLKLEVPKISGTINLVSGDPASDSYIWVRKWNSTYNYYEHTDYASTNEEGQFFINPSDGDYQLEFYPGWQNRKSEIGYSRNLCVGSTDPVDRPSSPEICDETHVLTEQFLAPNIKGIVCPAGEMADSCIEDGVRHSWVEILERGDLSADQPEYWSWIEGTSTDSDGNFALLLETGTNDEPKLYSLRVHPSYQEEQGVGKRVFVSVGENECKIGSTLSSLEIVEGGCLNLRIGLLSPNVSGALTYNNSNTLPLADQQYMKHSWVSVFTEDYQDYVMGSPTNSQGKFAAVLEDGTYFLDAYSNSSIAARSTLRLTVKVTTDPDTQITNVSWKYRNQSNEDYVTTPLFADFDFIPPNVRINLSESLTASHVILIKHLDPIDATREQPRRFVSTGTLASGVLTKGEFYSIKVVANYQERLDGTCFIPSVEVTVDEGETLDGVAQADVFDLLTCVPSP